MAGPTTVSVGNNDAAMYNAFKALTTNRDKNRGTIEISTTGGVTQLSCSQHHFYSSSTIRPNVNLNHALETAITQGVFNVANDLIRGVYDKNADEVASEKAGELIKFMNQVAEGLKAKLYAPVGGVAVPVAMSRKAIESIVTRIEEMKKYSADELQKIGADILCDLTTLKEVGEDRVADLISRGKTSNATLTRTLNDDKLCNEAAKMDFSLQKCGAGEGGNRPPTPCKENPFKMKSGETLDVVKAIQEENPTASICTQVCADARHYACGVFYGWKSQEETVVKNMDPMASAHLKGKGLIRPEIFSSPEGPQYRFAYTQGENRLSTSSGYMMKSKLGTVKSDFLFSSLPALGDNWYGMDTVGNTDYYCLARKQLGREVSEDECTKVNDVFEHLCELRNKKQLRDLTDNQFKDVMMLLMFGDEDLAGGETDRIVTNAINTVRNDTFDREKIGQRYEATIRQTIRGWIDTARNRGVTHFAGSAVGCGVFRNDVTVVAKVFAEEFVSRAGDMKFVYVNYGGTDPCATVFQNEFNRVYDETVARYRNEKFSPENAFDYAKHKNQAGHVFSFGKDGGTKAQQFFTQRLDFKKISEPGYITQIANKRFRDAKTGEDIIHQGVRTVLNGTKGSRGVPRAFDKDLQRTSGGYVMPDGSKIDPHAKDKGVPQTELYDRFTEKMTQGRVKRYDDLTGKDLKLVQFAMAMMNQSSVGPLTHLGQHLANDYEWMLMMPKPDTGYQVSFNKDGGLTFKAFTRGNVTGIHDGLKMLVEADKAKSDVSYSYEITYSAEKLDAILEHDWSDTSADWLTADKREFYFTCHIEE